MCTLHLFFQVFPDEPVLFAANRDEILDRAWRGPGDLSSVPRIWGPRDLVAGGTWLGVNEAGVLAGLANHEGTLRRDSASLCSRGAVVLETLRHGTTEEAYRFAQWAAPVCKAYTLLVADPDRAAVIDHGPDGTQTYRLLPGCHVITNARFRDPGDPKARRSLSRMETFASRGHPPTEDELAGFLSDHEPSAPGQAPLCLHPPAGSRFGTSSASVIRVGSDRQVRRFLFSVGPPCHNPLQDLTPPWRPRSSSEGVEDAAAPGPNSRPR
ncbi:MAG: NRDE family protein [Deferrisomatales bacterium]